MFKFIFSKFLRIGSIPILLIGFLPLEVLSELAEINWEEVQAPPESKKDKKVEFVELTNNDTLQRVNTKEKNNSTFKPDADNEQTGVSIKDDVLIKDETEVKVKNEDFVNDKKNIGTKNMEVGKIIISNRSFVKLDGPLVTLNLKKSPAADAILSLAEIGGYGVIFVSEDNSNNKIPNDIFDRLITLSFENETYARAVNSVLLASGLQGKIDNKTLIIGVNISNKSFSDQISKVYRLNQVSATYAADYLASLGASISKVTTTSVSSGSSQGSQTQSVLTGVETYGSGIGPLVGLTGTTDTRLQTITLVADNKKIIDVAESYLKQIDIMQRQVALTVRILDVSLDKGKNIDNSFAYKSGSQAFIVNDSGKLVSNFGKYKPPGSTAGGLPSKYSGADNVNPTVGIADKGSLLLSEGFAYPANSVFNYLSSQISSIDTNIIASPTVILSENADSLSTGSDGDPIGRSRANEALVKVGNKVITGYKLTKEEGSGSVYCEPTLENAGLSLGARIQKIDDNGYVTFTIEPRVSASVGSQDVGTCGTINTINERSLETGSVRVKNNHTLILTGVISEKDVEAISKWPLIGDIPVVGNLFKKTVNNKETRELVIMVTPNIIEDGLSTYTSIYTPKTDRLKEIMQKD
tara:strand:- start:4609 stop:6522 length:1914 start_codon:yes stop_codon:yes gene_type:complete